MEQFARELVGFLKQLQACPTDKATAAGESCLPAGRGLPELASQAEAALQRLDDQAASAVLRRIWQQALASKWDGKPVWVHGDLVPEHLLVQDGRLCGVIGFASAAVGDPACDYAMAWTFFNGRSREIFLDGLDTDTVCRAKDWALWVALTEQGGSDEAIPVRAELIIREILVEQCCS